MKLKMELSNLVIAHIAYCFMFAISVSFAYDQGFTWWTTLRDIELVVGILFVIGTLIFYFSKYNVAVEAEVRS